MKKKRTQAFLIPILLSLPLLQMVAVMIVGEVLSPLDGGNPLGSFLSSAGNKLHFLVSFEPEDRCVSPMR